MNSMIKRLFEQDRPMRIAFNNWYHTKTSQIAWDVKNGEAFSSRMHFQAGFNAALEYRKIDYENPGFYNPMIAAFQEWLKPYGPNWKPDIETAFSSGWEAGKRLH